MGLRLCAIGLMVVVLSYDFAVDTKAVGLDVWTEVRAFNDCEGFVNNDEVVVTILALVMPLAKEC